MFKQITYALQIRGSEYKKKEDLMTHCEYIVLNDRRHIFFQIMRSFYI